MIGVVVIAIALSWTEHGLSPLLTFSLLRFSFPSSSLSIVSFIHTSFFCTFVLIYILNPSPTDTTVDLNTRGLGIVGSIQPDLYTIFFEER